MKKFVVGGNTVMWIVCGTVIS